MQNTSGILGGAGIFQELTYSIPRDFPGPQPGTASSFNLSFRDISGHPQPTSYAYLNRLSPPANHWKGLRLDYGPNVKTGGATNWHWNQSGARRTFNIPDHALAGRTAANFGQTMRYLRPIGRDALVVGVVTDGYFFTSEFNDSLATGEWCNTIIEGSRITGGWTGAWVGAQAGGSLGASIGTAIAPGIGTAIGGAAGGIVGGGLGYFGGANVGGGVASGLF